MEHTVVSQIYLLFILNIGIQAITQQTTSDIGIKKQALTRLYFVFILAFMPKLHYSLCILTILKSNGRNHYFGLRHANMTINLAA